MSNRDASRLRVSVATQLRSPEDLIYRPSVTDTLAELLQKVRSAYPELPEVVDPDFLESEYIRISNLRTKSGGALPSALESLLFYYLRKIKR